MQVLPGSVTSYKRTPIFDQSTVPPGLLKAHQTKAGVWGKIIVLEGRLLYRILEPTIEEVVLAVGDVAIVEPQVLHEVTPLGEVRFCVDFYK